MNVTPYPMSVTPYPMSVTQYPMNVTQYPMNVTQYPMNVTPDLIRGPCLPQPWIPDQVRHDHLQMTPLMKPSASTSSPA